MNQTHIHLLLNHLPVFGSILGGLVLLHGIVVRSIQTKIAAYYVLILSSIRACIAYFTGEAAEESVENIQGVVESTIKQHEEFALYALIALIILGLVSLIGLYLSYTKSVFTHITALVVCIMSFLSFGLVARTGYLGGQIRHTEISNDTPIPVKILEKDKDD